MSFGVAILLSELIYKLMGFRQQYYIPTARELARLAGIQRAPILHHFAESLAGAATIRAFDQEGRFIDANLDLIDNHSRPWFHNVSAMEWLSFRMNLLSNFVFAFSLVLLVTLPEGIIRPSEYDILFKTLFAAIYDLKSSIHQINCFLYRVMNLQGLIKKWQLTAYPIHTNQRGKKA